MKSGQYHIFDYVHEEAVFITQDAMFNACFLLAVWAHFRGRAPTWWQFVLLLIAAAIWGGFQTTDYLWHVVNWGGWLSDKNDIIFSRLNFMWSLYMTTYLALLVRYVRAAKPWRTVPRLLTMFICFVSIGTFTLFHVTIVGGGLFESRWQRENMVMSLLHADVPHETVLQACEGWQMWCATASGSLPEVTEAFEAEVPQDPVMISLLGYLLHDQGRAAWPEARYVGTNQYYMEAEKFDLGTHQTKSTYMDKRGNDWLIMLDVDGFDKLTSKYNIYAACLILAAHFVWLIGGMVMIWLHDTGRTYRLGLRSANAEKLAKRDVVS